MHGLLVGTVLLSSLGPFASIAQQKPEPPVRSEMARAFGELPKPGDLADILSCAGANEVLWTTAHEGRPAKS